MNEEKKGGLANERTNERTNKGPNKQKILMTRYNFKRHAIFIHSLFTSSSIKKKPSMFLSNYVKRIQDLSNLDAMIRMNLKGKKMTSYTIKDILMCQAFHSPREITCLIHKKVGLGSISHNVSHTWRR
jgi:hypothetical protein